MDDLLIIWEYGNNTNPLVEDTDGDGFSDGEEIRIGTDPLDPKNHPLEDWELMLFAFVFLIIALITIKYIKIIRFPKKKPSP